MTLEWYELKPSSLRWGDYGTVLTSGYYDRDGQGALLLNRAGPFIPPISLPARYGYGGQRRTVVTSEFRDLLVQCGLFETLDFRPVIKKRIVALSWHLWDRSAPQPPQYPPGGEPESYIRRRRHNPSAADEMGDVWEVVPPLIPLQFKLEPELVAIMPHRHYPIWFCGHQETGAQIISTPGKEFISKHAGEWVRFEPLRWRWEGEEASC
jgi:hypothetical protein